MKPALFVDASAWIALEVTNDQSHAITSAFMRAQGHAFDWLTTNWVLSEVVTWLRRRAGCSAATVFGNRICASTTVTLVRVLEHHEERAWRIFKDYTDKDFGFVDCTSFAVMESLGVQAALTFDKHFRQFGFQMLPVVS